MVLAIRYERYLSIRLRKDQAQNWIQDKPILGSQARLFAGKEAVPGQSFTIYWPRCVTEQGYFYFISFAIDF